MSEKGPGEIHPNTDRVRKAGKTKRARSRMSVLEAVDAALLAGVTYDELTVTDLAASAGVAPATIYASFGQKSQIVEELVNSRLLPVVAESFERRGQRDWPPLPLLGDHLRRLGQASFEHRELSAALLRVVGCEYLGSSVADDLGASVPAFGCTAELVGDVSRSDPATHSRLAVRGLERQWVIGLLDAAVSNPRHRRDEVIDRLLATWLPATERLLPVRRIADPALRMKPTRS